MCRRNYTGIFEDIQRTPALMQSQGVVLTLIGRGDLHIPDALYGKVVKRTSLDYKVQSGAEPGLDCMQASGPSLACSSSARTGLGSLTPCSHLQRPGSPPCSTWHRSNPASP